MPNSEPSALCYVVKADDLLALNYLADDHPVPLRVEWINRATDRILSQSSLEQLLRTFHHPDASPSVVQLRETSGLRAVFATSDERGAFARLFADACIRERGEREYRVTAIFPTWEDAEAASRALGTAGFLGDRISLLSRSTHFADPDGAIRPARAPGHTRSKIVATVAGGGVAGAALGVAVLVVPGLGPVAAAGAVLASTYSAVATASGIIGATGAAMAVMLSDKDVDTFAENDLERQWHKGRTFLAADMRHSALSAQQVRQLLTEHGGRCVDNETPDE